ncbi:transmembrane and coiled-coil domain-containing protein 4 isoform X2 [Hyaena hyaena]|uniref:transmembrane and coiled-coil domain-containing protein 4 isoform X2 n=1 Tax=Hyaena hyaena TaxID=95912 RepID=UPI001920C62B|nr:transmembrane and coiled-coil domain-containing protein 4 isoform X2 [Hyaena hyaena]
MDRSSQGPSAAEPAMEGEPHLPVGRELAEANRFAYAALCGISLSQLFPEPEQSSFCTEFVTSLVKWLELPGAVLPTMTAFANGLGGEGADVFAPILLKDPILKDNPLVIIQDLLSFSLQDGRYDARARVLICHMTSLFHMPVGELDLLEETFLESLKETKEEESETAEASRKKKENRRKWKRYLLIGLATVGGGTVIGVTGGLAAPLVAAGAATIIGSAGAAALGSVAGIAVLTSLFGAAGAGLTGTFSAPWAALARSREQYCLAWEAKYLMELGNALETILSGLANMVAQEALKYTVLSGIVAALTWPASLLTVANVIDNPWGVCLHRSAEVGKHLAHILLSRQQGQRPVTLIGFSLGARVIYFCLQEMAQEKDCQGIIEDVVLLGAPVEGEAKHWEPFRKVVSGRIINGYCRGDWLLSFVYRTSSVQLRVAGLQPVLLQDRRVENVDLSSVVSGHLDYAKQMDVILKTVGIHTRPGWGEKGFLLAPGSLPQEEPQQTAATSSSDKTTPGDNPRAATATDPVPAGLDPVESPQICGHGMDPNPLGCPDCASETQGPCPGLD